MDTEVPVVVSPKDPERRTFHRKHQHAGEAEVGVHCRGIVVAAAHACRVSLGRVPSERGHEAEAKRLAIFLHAWGERERGAGRRQAAQDGERER